SARRSFANPCLFCDLECGFGTTTGVRTCPQRDARRLGGELVLIVPDGKRFGPEIERHFFRFTASKRNTLETTERPDRLRDAGSFEPQVKLDGFLPRSCSRVGNLRVDAHNRPCGSLAQLFIQRLRAQLWLVELEVPVAIAGIRQPVAERELRGVLLVDVTRDEFVGSILRGMSQVDLTRRAPRTQGVVVQRLLSDASRPTHNQPPDRIC